ncbi:MAG: NAD(+) synthase [Candidatus Coatesbacteria bacterium RBG_13_66_14]|uniref:NH(3)-dependent NAD(+) synthetase n=1 Tax=Candidatus Coatesbacteria bacterium RBG_13_66_14 TaxID=1817816 RepID=A0A1F5FH56_9BACT|nr:MAG: NAD(+) synthase [Candidatus Coatesbacteria bacterium RBG_13_66_14]
MVLDRRFQRDYKKLAEDLAGWVAGYVRGAGFSGVVLGVSGGVDSGVSAALAAKTLGVGNVNALLLPHAESDPASEADGRLVCDQLGIKCERVDITSFCAPIFEKIPPDARVRRGNVKARVRMIILFDRSSAIPALVLGTGNKTEALLGYTTLHGDDACGLNPLAELYKTEVWELAKILGLPERVIAKAPSADLWPKQTDEGELGMRYLEADRILFDFAERGMDRGALVAAGHDAAVVDHLLGIVERCAFKCRGPATPPAYH